MTASLSSEEQKASPHLAPTCSSLDPVALLEGEEYVQRMPEALANLLRNESYVRQVGDFVSTTYGEALASESPAQLRDAVDATHRYAKEALEAIADHVQNCANNLTDFLDCHDRALDELVHQVDLIQHRVKSARQLQSVSTDPSRINVISRPKQALGKPRIMVESGVSPMARFDGWKIDYTQLDAVGIAPADAGSGAYLSVANRSSRRNLYSHISGSMSPGSSRNRASVAPPGPPPSINAPGPPPSISGPPGPPPAVGLSPSSVAPDSRGSRGTTRRYGTARRALQRSRLSVSSMVDDSAQSHSAQSPSISAQSDGVIPPPLPKPVQSSVNRPSPPPPPSV